MFKFLKKIFSKKSSAKFDYNAQIARLLEKPEEYGEQWLNGLGLFAFMRDGGIGGCPVTIKNGDAAAARGKKLVFLTNSIKNDPLIPFSVIGTIPTKEVLNRFKMYQEQYDDVYPDRAEKMVERYSQFLKTGK